MKKNSNQTIKCDVKSCKYNDDIDCLCTLDKIDISCTCNNCECKNVKETVCKSFKEGKE